VAAVVVGLVVAFGLLRMVDALTGDGADEAGSRSGDPAASATEPSGAPSAPASAAPVRCWDGSGADAVEACSVPDGATGLAWVFPQLDQQRCGRPTHSGPGVVLRVLCTARLSDGSRIQLGYYQWTSVAAGQQFYDDQQLTRSDSDGFHGWTRTAGHTLKSALLYVDAPFSETVTLPRTARATEQDLQLLKPRPPEQLRGAPVD
jgi:hypothetical protein